MRRVPYPHTHRTADRLCRGHPQQTLQIPAHAGARQHIRLFSLSVLLWLHKEQRAVSYCLLVRTDTRTSHTSAVCHIAEFGVSKPEILDIVSSRTALTTDPDRSVH